eukprot:5882632-Alexandrium_andersonii.AAC.1
MDPLASVMPKASLCLHAVGRLRSELRSRWRADRLHLSAWSKSKSTHLRARREATGASTSRSCRTSPCSMCGGRPAGA